MAGRMAGKQATESRARCGGRGRRLRLPRCSRRAAAPRTPPASGGEGGDGTGKVGVILPLLTSPFWQSYNDYVPKMAKSEDVDALKTVNSNSDPSQQITDINNQLNQGVKGLVVAPLDSAAIEAGLDQAERKGVPVVAVDVAPDKGKVAMVVRAEQRRVRREGLPVPRRADHRPARSCRSWATSPRSTAATAPRRSAPA